MSTRAGGAVTLALGDALRCNVAIDASGLFTSEAVLAGGVEAWVGGLGMRVGHDGRSGATAGLSLRLENVQVDWAIVLRRDLGQAHSVSVAFRF